MAQHGAQKFDLESVPQISEWAHKLCKWYNILFKKDGEAPLQLPECFRRVQKPRPRTPEPVPASDGSEREDGRAQEPQTEDVQSPQSSVLKNAAAIEAESEGPERMFYRIFSRSHKELGKSDLSRWGQALFWPDRRP